MSGTRFNTSMASSTEAGGKGVELVVVEFILFLLVGLIAFVGNLLTCIALYRNPLLRTVTNVFVFSLALTDLLMSVLVIPFVTISVVEGRRVFGDDGCQLNGIICYNLAGISLLTLTLIAVNRYVHVVKPSLYPVIYTKRSAVIMVASAWVITILISVVAFFALGVRFVQTVANPAHCNILYTSTSGVSFYTAVIFLYNVPTSVLIAVCYALVYRRIRRHNLTMREVTRRAEFARIHGVEESTVTKMFAAVLVGFYLCWIPVFVANVLNAVTAIKPDAHVYSSFYHLLPVYTSSMINPIIYAILAKQFRAEFFKIFCCNKHGGLELVPSQGSTERTRVEEPQSLTTLS